MAEIYQIGSGMIGQAMALDLAKSHKVHLADLKIENVCHKDGIDHISNYFI